MKRYNVNGMPVEFVEALNGYWIKNDDYEKSVLDHSKTLSRMGDQEAALFLKAGEEYVERLEKQQHIIIILSVVAFALAAIGLFKILM